VALAQSDVTELLDAIRAGGDLDVTRKGEELVLQALVDAEATRGSAPSTTSVPRNAAHGAAAAETSRLPPRPVT